MAKAVVCPVCLGKGELTDYNSGQDTSAYQITRICYGCNGKGWVEVAEDPAPYIPYYPPYIPQYPFPSVPYPYPSPWYYQSSFYTIVGGKVD